MDNPPHPGEILKEDVSPEIGLTVGEFTAHLGVSCPHLSKLLNQHAGITTAEMDLKISEALGQSPGLWIRMQAAMIFGKQSKSPASMWRRCALLPDALHLFQKKSRKQALIS